MVCHTDVEYLVLGSTGTRVGTNRKSGCCFLQEFLWMENLVLVENSAATAMG